MGDNAGPTAGICDAVKKWNATHDSPRFVIATTSEMMHEFERCYADKIPQFRGDFTPYWEDGAGSSARETAANRDAAERLVQAETLSAMLHSGQPSEASFHDVWRNVLLYDEHTWGAYNSVSEPDSPFAKQLWKVKQGFALDADRQSRRLLDGVLESRGGLVASAVDVFNTSSWPRTDLVTLPKELAPNGDLVRGPDGQIALSQRLSTGELVFLAKDIPALAGSRYTISAWKCAATGSAKADGTTLSAGQLTVKVDPATGTIVSLKAGEREFADPKTGVGINQYVYLPGANVKDAKVQWAGACSRSQSRAIGRHSGNRL